MLDVERAFDGEFLAIREVRRRGRMHLGAESGGRKPDRRVPCQIRSGAIGPERVLTGDIEGDVVAVRIVVVDKACGDTGELTAKTQRYCFLALGALNFRLK